MPVIRICMMSEHFSLQTGPGLRADPFCAAADLPEAASRLVTPGGERHHLCPSRSVYRGAGRPIQSSPARRFPESRQLRPQVAESMTDFHGGEPLHFPAVFQVLDEVKGAGFAARPEVLRDAGDQARPEAGDQRAERADLIGAGAGHGHLGPGDLAPRQRAEVVAAVPEGIGAGESHHGDRPQADRCRTLDARLQGSREHQPPRLAEASLASTFTSAWASEEPNTSPAGPSRSATRLRAACTRVPSARVAHAPTAIFPVRSASQAWRNASCQESSRLDQSPSDVTGGSLRASSLSGTG
jgi:hypothetical protein